MPYEILKALKLENNITAPYEVFDILNKWIDDCAYQMNMNLNVGHTKQAEAWKQSVLEINELIVGLASPFVNTKLIEMKEEKNGIDK